MLTLRPMSEDEFDRFIDYSARSYSKVRAEVDGEPYAAVLERTRTFMAQKWPRGIDTPDQFACVVADEAGERLGQVWFSVQGDDAGRNVYLWDIEIEAAARGRGVGRGAMLLLEERARALGAVWIELHVFAYNTVARGLYASLGYVPGELEGRMRKTLAGR